MSGKGLLNQPTQTVHSGTINVGRKSNGPQKTEWTRIVFEENQVACIGIPMRIYSIRVHSRDSWANPPCLRLARLRLPASPPARSSRLTRQPRDPLSWLLSMGSDKLETLRAWFRERGSCLIAYSGGVDSVFLALVGFQSIGDRSLAVIADSPSLPRQELEDAVELARRFQFPLRTVFSREFENPQYVANPVNRCYFCKFELFSEMKPLARSLGVTTLVYGENASDQADVRPGSLAAEEFEVRAPLKELGWTKLEIREWSARLGLPTAEKAQMACLSSRIPHGEAVHVDKLRMIEASEKYLKSLGFHDLRVRHHELKNGALARIEIGPEEFQGIQDPQLRLAIARNLRTQGYHHVTLDLVGYARSPKARNDTPIPDRAEEVESGGQLSLPQGV